jgi:hypothetical protein
MQRFADRLARRHALVRAYPGAVSRVVARAAGVWRRRPPRAMRVTAALEMVVRADGRRASAAGLTIGPNARPAGPPRAEFPRPRSMHDARVERLLARRERVERMDAVPVAGSARRTPPGATNVTFPVARPVPRVLRRERHETGAPEPRERDTAPVRSTWRVGPAPNAELLTPAQLDRVADQVLHTMDRRLLAYRERRGRS